MDSKGTRSAATPDTSRVSQKAQSSRAAQLSNRDAPCEKGQDNRSSELCAQWKAADAAYDAAKWAQLSLILGVIGTLALFATLYWTRRAVHVAMDATKDAESALAIAERNAEAAAEQVAVSRDTAKQQLRAYLGLHPVEMSEISAASAPISIKMTIENSGSTPANEWRVAWCWKVTDEPPSVELFDKLVEPYRKYHGEHSFAPKNTKTMTWTIAIDAESKLKIANGQAKFYYMGEIIYMDIFSEEHKTEFFYVYNPNIPNRLGQAGVKNRIG